MNRSDAKMIAEELHKFIRNDVRKAVTEMATAETEEYLNAKQAAVFLGIECEVALYWQREYD
jgi:hypothetical protein